MKELYIRGIKKNKDLAGMDEYLSRLPLLRHLQELEFGSRVIFLVGENGTGKSTLLEAMTVGYGFNPEGGTRNFCFSSHESHSNLHQYITLIKGVTRPRDGFFLRAESFYNVATEVDRLDREGAVPLIDAYGGKSLHEQSHGESFLALIANRFSGKGLYLLDEPEAALSPTRLLTLMARMHELEKKDSQFIIATHSPILMAYPGSEIYVLDEEGLKKTDYEETEHVQLTKSFLADPERYFHYLFQEDTNE